MHDCVSGTSQFVNQPFRRIEAVAFIALLRPTFEDQARFGMTGGGVGVVFVNLQATLIHAEIHTTSDHMVTATLPERRKRGQRIFGMSNSASRLSSFSTLSVA